MRVGDVRRIEGFVNQGISDDEILAHYKNDYDEKEIKVFIENAKKLKKEKDKADKVKSKSDPLG